MKRDELAAADRAARATWKSAFFQAYNAIGTPAQREAVRELHTKAKTYRAINDEAKAAGVDYDPRKARR
jgi:hypothetical protein